VEALGTPGSQGPRRPCFLYFICSVPSCFPRRQQPTSTFFPNAYTLTRDHKVRPCFVPPLMWPGLRAEGENEHAMPASPLRTPPF
jgi:hypothetical protein